MSDIPLSLRRDLEDAIEAYVDARVRQDQDHEMFGKAYRMMSTRSVEKAEARIQALLDELEAPTW